MLDTAGQSSQALMFCLRYDFPTEWSAFINGTGNFAVTLDKQFFPYPAQSAKQLTIDALTLYSANGGKVASITPAIDLGALSTSLSTGGGTAPVSLPSDATAMVREQSQQVFMVLQYHFGTSNLTGDPQMHGRPHQRAPRGARLSVTSTESSFNQRF